MEKQTEKKELYKSLVKAINELQNPSNSADNPYFNSKYVPLANIIDIAKPVLGKYNLAVMQVPFVMYEAVGNPNSMKERAIVKIMTTILHENGESLEFPPILLKAGGDTPHAIGSAITYGRRYSLTSILGIAGKEDDDDGNNASNGQIERQQTSQQLGQQNQQMAKSNMDIITIEAIAKSIKESKSGKGTPFCELTLENNGKTINAIAKDGIAFEQAKALKEGHEATFTILTTQGFHFIQSIAQVATNGD
ncbi:ERF family protein [Bacillus andreraoultii]|uniref:ERF family protein n=1 Tax=Bacillus andreraoultii TaxID=1499685 RepID=UPI00067F4B15|nr:ERF family protein [Bacillus andreraoultii]